MPRLNLGTSDRRQTNYNMHLSTIPAVDKPAESQQFSSSGVYGSKFAAVDLPAHHMNDEEMPANIAYKLIQDELALDGKPFLNLASFVTTYMEPEAENLMTDAMSKNFIDLSEYEATGDLHNRCVAMIGNLFNVPKTGDPLGVSTVGSSEAIMLATLAMKRRWQERQKAAGKDIHNPGPNIVMSSDVQVCWEKAARYFEINEKYVMCTKDSYSLTPKEAVDLVDENTIGICCILGSTYTGVYNDVKKTDELLQTKNRENGWNCGIHVDAASGGFVAPFIHPDLEWDFRVPSVVSINTSGHKYGLCYPGIGWALWRSPEYLPKDLIFNINYLGADQASFTLNFSKGASQVIAQYYQLIRLGRNGYTAIMRNLTNNANYLSKALEETGLWTIMSSTDGLPLVAFRMAEKKHYNEFDVARELRERQWVVPAYTMPPNISDLRLLRVVLREDFTHARCGLFLRDLKASVDHLDSLEKRDVEVARDSKAKTSGPGTGVNSKHRGARGHKDTHSLQKHGKTHGVC